MSTALFSASNLLACHAIAFDRILSTTVIIIIISSGSIRIIIISMSFALRSSRSMRSEFSRLFVTRKQQSAAAAAAAVAHPSSLAKGVNPICHNNIYSSFQQVLSTRVLMTIRSAATFSTTSAPPPTAGARAEDNPQKSSPKKDETSNIFLDNLGTIFLSAIGLVIASLVRSFYGSTRKNNLRNQLEEESALDPIEVDDLRFANPRINVKVFRSLIHDLRQEYSSDNDKATYQEFVHSVRKLLQSKHDIPTIELGHLLDRVALQIAKEQGTTTTEAPQPVTLWLVLISMALNAPVPDRIRILYEILETENQSSSNNANTVDDEGIVAGSNRNNNNNNKMVTLLKVRDLVAYLQSTSQLVIDTQVIPTEGKAYPIQQHHRASPDELVHWDGSLHDEIDIDALADILRSKSVCAWGECYSKRKFA